MNYSNIKSYDRIAVIYPYLMRTIDYKRWAKYINEIVKKDVNKEDNVLELAAGDCKLAHHLKNYYPDILVTDICHNMLLQSEDNEFQKICCDMTSLPLNKKFKLVYSTFDSINYLTSKLKLLKMFKEVKRVLKTSGIFTFDVSLEWNSLKHTKEPIRSGIYKGIQYIQKSRYNSRSKIHLNKFIIRANGDEYSETHKQKIYPFEDYFKLIEDAGLFVQNCFDAFTFNNGNSDCERVQFVVKN
jgi:ubiquinone/menaquinone biosynthesis C-methylase UbiE